jgi:hypothetical protein
MCGQQQIVFGCQMLLLSAVMLLHHFLVLKLNDIISHRRWQWQQIVFGCQMVLLSAVMLLHHFFVLELNDISL